jgi:hypothetical protein
MSKHYRVKADCIEIVADQDARRIIARDWRRLKSWIKWKVAVILRLRVR